MTTVDELSAEYGHTWVIETWCGGCAATRRAKYTQDQYDQGLSYGLLARTLVELAERIAAEEALQASLSESRKPINPG
ncbi:hypothetical protein [Nonomuraea sp. 10N515B]|uniref:hypothetical protein n=1 Tax=Nonomuraea sp. 10N515B TaxID=3457422 RepID=UPI003FCCE42B